MDYHSKKQKMVSLLFILAFGYSASAMATQEANTCQVHEADASMQSFTGRLAVTHADSWKIVKAQLLCSDDLAKDVRHLLINIDDAIFQYLHYNGHEKKYATHIGKFNNHLHTLKSIVERHEKHPGCAHAVNILKAMQQNLAELIKHVTKAQGSKGMIAAMGLGKDVEPLIRNFKGYFPSLLLTVDDQIRTHYNIQDVTASVLLGHLQKRLETK